MDFFQKVFKVTMLIPQGKVITYGAIANYLVAPHSARMVGWELNKSNTHIVPAHRVVNKKGLLTGKFHFDGTTLMQELLSNEGIIVVDNQIQEMENYFWDPAKELL